MQKAKRLTASLLFLLCLSLCASALALDSFRFEAKVTASEEVIMPLPFDGKTDEMFVEAGDRVEPGDKLLTLQTNKLLAKEAGVVEAVFATPGADGKTVEETYHAAVFLKPEHPLYVLCAIKGAVQTKENTTYTWGETIYIKNTKKGHTGVGRVINIKNYTYTVEVLSGDLEDDDAVNLYRDPAYGEKSRVGNGTVHPFELTKINLEGFVVDVLVKPGDTVKPGDAVLTYAPSTELSVYAKAQAIVLKADAATASVTLAPTASLCLSAKLSALELSLLEVRPAITITQDGNPDLREEGRVLWVSGVPDESGKYEVRVSCPSGTLRIGAAYQIEAK